MEPSDSPPMAALAALTTRWLKGTPPTNATAAAGKVMATAWTTPVPTVRPRPAPIARNRPYVGTVSPAVARPAVQPGEGGEEHESYEEVSCHGNDRPPKGQGHVISGADHRPGSRAGGPQPAAHRRGRCRRTAFHEQAVGSYVGGELGGESGEPSTMLPRSNKSCTTPTTWRSTVRPPTVIGSVPEGLTRWASSWPTSTW